MLSRLVRSALLGIALLPASSLLAQQMIPAMPMPAPMAGAVSQHNQRLAEGIAAHLKQSGLLRGYTVGLNVQGGSVEVRGTVADSGQRDEVIRLVQGVPGVVRVQDRLVVAQTGSTLVSTQGPSLAPQLLPNPQIVDGGKDTMPKTMNSIPEPTPMQHMGQPGFTDVNPPRMPPYAWPTYAPYNNYSRVAYPEAYPAHAWPFIGPIHPFPKVPLGWRSVKLEWDDGYWWFSQVGTKHSWWKLRYW